MPEETHVVVIGAGPSGLAVAACLARRGKPFVVLEEKGQVGSTWRNHYERLHLHTIKQFSALPGMPWPTRVPMYPSRAQVVEYLEAYAARFGIAPRFGQRVTEARRDGSRWIVRTPELEIAAREVIVASGYNRVPKLPSWPGQAAFDGTIVHSSSYRTGEGWRGKRALVVGIGNSGGEIALDLWECGATTSLCVRSPVHVVPRDLYGIPAQLNSLFVFSKLPPRLADKLSLPLLERTVGDLSRWGIRRPAVGPATQVVEQGRIPLIDIGTVSLIKQGKIVVKPAIRSFTRAGVVFDDGTEEACDLVVCATGYRAALEGFLPDAKDYVDERGYPRWHGTEGPVPGLFFIGFRNPLTGQLHDIAQEAERVAGQIARG